MKAGPAPAGVPNTRYLFFSGKGGVGKTTCASATALMLAGQIPRGQRVLLFSTDPAHSLSDSLGTVIGDRIREVASPSGSLDAWEMDAGAALDTFRERHHHVLKTIADRGTLLDESDINGLLDLSLPGLDEVMALFELSEFDAGGTYRHIVVDTAPSGHTTRLLHLPAVFARWIRALDLMSEKHRYLVAQLSRRRRTATDDVDVFLETLAQRVDRVRRVLYSKEQSSFVMVAIPEPMVVEETLRYARAIRDENVPLTDLVINRVEAPHASCAYCKARRGAQAAPLRRLRSEFKAHRVRTVSLQSAEVRGAPALRHFGQLLWSAAKDVSAISNTPAASDAARRPFAVGEPEVFSTLRRLIVVGGKGGVGKTTTAAALAMDIARRHPEKRFLVFSADPAHSLSDSVGEPLGGFRKGIAGIANLDGAEVDAAAEFDALKERYRSWIEEIFFSLTAGSGWEMQFDREAMQELIAIAPPGIDEIAALSRISDYFEGDAYATIVLDTAPTGHLLRFLALPDLALEWVHTFIRLLLKYRSVVRSSGVAEELVGMSKGIKRVLTLFRDPSLCGFMAVAIPEKMSLSETADAVAGIQALGMSFERLLINGIVPDSAARSCSFCQARRESQDDAINRLRAQFDSSPGILLGYQLTKAVTGPALLDEYRRGWSEMLRRRARGKA